MAPFLAIFSLARKAYNHRAVNKNSITTLKKPMSTAGKLRLFAALPVTLTAIAFLLSFLCVFAGNKPGMMDDYAVFTLNMSRVGENILQKVDGKVAAVHFKRSLSVEVPTGPMITPAPTTMITLLARADINSELGHLTSQIGNGAHSIVSSAQSKATALQSNVASGVNSAESAAKSKASLLEAAASSKANSALDAVKTNLVAVVNKAYHSAIAELDLQDFYALHISSSCTGTYTDRKSGKNVTVGDSAPLPPPTNGSTKAQVDVCAKHSAVNPLKLIRIIYWIGVVFMGLALCLGIYGLIRPSQKIALYNVFGTLPAFLFLGLASAVTHGVSSGATHLINSIGQDIGISGTAGGKFLQLTWATVTLLICNMAFWTLVWFAIRRVEKKNSGVVPRSGFSFGRKRADRTSAIVLDNMVTGPPYGSGAAPERPMRPSAAYIQRSDDGFI